MFINIFDTIAQFVAGTVIADGDCIEEFGFYAWFLIYPYIFFKTVKDDSEYHWKDACHLIIESTQESIENMNIFTLPNNYSAHFESPEDQQFRFKKLKQMISGYLPLIPFKKIQFFNETAVDFINDKPLESNAIGIGTTAKVYRGKYGKKEIAIKSMLKINSLMSWTNLTLIFRESLLSSSLTHANIVQFLGASLTYDCFYLIYEYCIFGDLNQIIIENSHSEYPQLSSFSQRILYLNDIANGMQFIHKSGFVHRDLKTANVVVNVMDDHRFIAKICDFGVSRKVPEKQQKQMRINNAIMNQNKQIQNERHSMYCSPSLSHLSSDNSRDSENCKNISFLNYRKIHDFHDWEILATEFQTKEILRTIHVGTPAFLAPEILIKLVKAKGVIFEKEKRQRKYRIKNKRGKKRINDKTNNDNNTCKLLMDERNVKQNEIKIDFEEKPVNDPMIFCDYATDVYSFGMIIWSMLTGKIPYKGLKPIDMILMIKNAERLQISNEEWLLWSQCSDVNIEISELKILLNNCWAQYPQQRPTFKQLVVILKEMITKVL